jgi:hypothetical protein
MAKPRHAQTGSVPTDLPKTPPQDYVLSDHSFTLQSIMEMQKALGQLTKAVETLTEESKKSSTKLDTISHKIYAAEVVGGLLVLISGGAFYLFWKIWDTVAPLIQIKLPH